MSFNMKLSSTTVLTDQLLYSSVHTIFECACTTVSEYMCIWILYVLYSNIYVFEYCMYCIRMCMYWVCTAFEHVLYSNIRIPVCTVFECVLYSNTCVCCTMYSVRTSACTVIRICLNACTEWTLLYRHCIRILVLYSNISTVWWSKFT